MTATVFDTLKFARALHEKASFSREQAEGLADAMAEAMRSDLATKTDLRELELRLEAKIEPTKAEVVKWMFSAIGLQTLVIVATVFTLIRAFVR
jgi:hypothetical protein